MISGKLKETITQSEGVAILMQTGFAIHNEKLLLKKFLFVFSANDEKKG